VKVLLTNNALGDRGGSESYLETIAHGLRRLEHEPVFFSPRLGEVAASLRRAGFVVTDDVSEVPADIDVIHGQHVPAVAAIRTRFASTPLLFATHSWFVPIEDPVSALSASAFLAFNDFTAERLSAHAATSGKPIHRLTQPVDISFRDHARVPIASESPRAVAVSRSQNRSLAQIEAACAQLGIPLEQVGVADTESPDARVEIFAADIVFAIGRSAVEAMAAGRAVFVMDESTVGGWITRASYQGFERDGFTGFGGDTSDEDLGAILKRYSPDLGREARRLAVRHHAVQKHAAQLVAIYQSIGADQPRGHVVDSVASLAAENMSLESRAVAAEWASSIHLRQLREMRGSLSWRITAPLRIARGVTRKRRPRSE
jgi:hypothetical protein